MSSTAPITPEQWPTTTVEISSFTVTIVNLTLFTSATLNVMLFDSTGKMVDNVMLELAGIDSNGWGYSEWGKDDTYIMDYVAYKLGFTMT